jgi:hypothetical protein
LINNAKEHNSDMVVCGFKFAYDDGKIIRKKIAEEFIDIDELGMSRYLVDYYLQFKHSFCVWNKLYKNDLIKKHAIKFDPTSSFAEDLLFNLFYLSHTKIISTISMELLNYYQREDSLSRFPENVLCNVTEVVSKYEVYTKKNNVINLAPTFFCSQFVTSLGYLRSSKDKEYVESCLRATTKNKLFKKYCMRILLNKDCSNFLISQGNNFNGRLYFKLIVLMLMLGQDSFVMNRLIKVAQ